MATAQKQQPDTADQDVDRLLERLGAHLDRVPLHEPTPRPPTTADVILRHAVDSVRTHGIRIESVDPWSSPDTNPHKMTARDLERFDRGEIPAVDVSPERWHDLPEAARAYLGGVAFAALAMAPPVGNRKPEADPLGRVKAWENIIGTVLYATRQSDDDDLESNISAHGPDHRALIRAIVEHTDDETRERSIAFQRDAYRVGVFKHGNGRLLFSLAHRLDKIQQQSGSMRARRDALDATLAKFEGWVSGPPAA